jgi:hypothetical protein
MRFGNFLVGVMAGAALGAPLALPLAAKYDIEDLVSGTSKVLEYMREMGEAGELEGKVGRLEDNANLPLKDGYDYLSVYDGVIKSSLNEFNGRLRPGFPLDISTIRKMIYVESGSEEHRDNAFRYDPLQIASDGDALTTLSLGLEYSDLIGDFSDLKNSRYAVFRDGEWDYSGSNLDARAALRGGIGFLFHKAAIRGSVERGRILEHEIKSGDTYSGITSELETTIQSLIRNNPSVDPRKWQIGNKIKYRKARIGIVGWKSWDDAIEDYNGSRKYLLKVKDAGNVIYD